MPAISRIVLHRPRISWTGLISPIVIGAVLLMLVHSPLLRYRDELVSPVAQPGTGAVAAQDAAPSTAVPMPSLKDLASLSDPDLGALFAAHPALIDALVAAHRPATVASWWAGLTAPQQDALVQGAPELVGRWDGLPPEARIAANRINASADLHRLIAGHAGPGLVGAAAGTIADAVDYLRRVVTGAVQLYLWDPAHSAVIEMAGDPRTAKSALFVVLGTNANLASYTERNPATDFAQWQVAHARPDAGVVAFTVMTGPMPYLTPDLIDLWSNGPQNNAFANARGAEYARFAEGVDAALPHLPTLSYEHSYATAVGSAAEHDGAHFDTRFLAAGVGATSGWKPRRGTTYYAVQAPNDINRYFAGIQIAEVGFSESPASIPGVHILDSGDSGLPMDPGVLAGEMAVFGPIGVGLQVPGSVVNHNAMMSADVDLNGTVLRDVAKLVLELGGVR